MKWRKFFVGILCFLLSLFLVGYVGLVMINSVIDENLIKDVLKKKMESEINQEVIDSINFACSLGKINELPIPMGNTNLTLTCDEITNKSKEEVLDIISGKLANLFFYREIDCEILDCLKEGKLDVLLSNKSKLYFQNLERIFLVLTIVFAVLILFITKSIPKSAKTIGSTLVITIFPVFILDFFVKKSVVEKLPENIKFVQEIILERISSLTELYLTILISGIVLLCFGFICEKLKRKN